MTPSTCLRAATLTLTAVAISRHAAKFSRLTSRSQLVIARKRQVDNFAQRQTTVAVLRGGRWGGARPPCENYAPLPPPHYNETGYKVARLQNSCSHSLASHSWCQITPFTQSCIMSSGILPSQIQMWPPRWPLQTAASRNAPDKRCK